MEVVKCKVCHRKIVVNPLKHQYDDNIFCPFCGHAIPNPFRKPLKVNVRWLERKVMKRKYYDEVKKFLREYGFKDGTVGKRFSLNEWKKGARPKVTLDMLRERLGLNASEERIKQEVNKILRLMKGEY